MKKKLSVFDNEDASFVTLLGKKTMQTEGSITIVYLRTNPEAEFMRLPPPCKESRSRNNGVSESSIQSYE